jgi:TRAP-type C4-dicarboxylate transport system substrate-binding protein
VNTFPGGTLLGAKEMMDGVIAGQADIGCLCMAYQPGRFVVTNATGLPVGIPDARTGSLVLLDLFNKYQPEEFSQVKVLALFTTAQSNIMSKAAVRSLEDLQGLSLRGSGPAAQVLGALGANPVGMPMSDTPEALQKGVIKGLLSSLEVMKDFKYAETCRYVTLIDTVIYPFAVVMNQARWNSLPADVKQVMEDLVAEQSEWTGVYMDNHVKESVDWSKETYQVEVISLDAAEKARWEERLRTMTDKWIGEAKAKGLPAEEILADIRAAVEKHRN